VVVVTLVLLLLAPAPGWAQDSPRRSAPRPAAPDTEEDPPEAGEVAGTSASEMAPSEVAGTSEAEGDARARISCLEDASEEGYQRKGVQKRDFLKRRRFEVGALGGLYASDAMSSTYTFGGALAFYPSEDFGLEGLVTFTPVQFRLERPFNSFDGRRRFQDGYALQVMGGLLFSPVHAKFKATEETIVHGDLFLTAGAGRTFHDSVQGLSWQVGAGFKLYLGRFFAFRFDVRDFILPQEILGRSRITHNLTVLGGLSFWLL
jgi:outer membrane beta-barrel protein